MTDAPRAPPMISRRRSLAGVGAIVLTGPAGIARAEDGLLERLRRQQFVRVGIANAPPFSALRPDGTLTGVGPAMARRVLEQLGVPRLEGAIATYGELIPGMFAGRWDFVAAAMTITKERCSQVLFADPMTFEGPCIVSTVAGAGKPRTISDLARLKATVGALSGGAQYRQLVDGGVALDKISQFGNETTMIDGLLAGRVQFVYATHLLMTEITKRRRITLDIVFPVSDAPAPGASNVFRPGDVEFHAAYQRELRTLKTSTEFFDIARQFGFETPAEMAGATSDEQCRLAAAPALSPK